MVDNETNNRDNEVIQPLFRVVSRISQSVNLVGLFILCLLVIFLIVDFNSRFFLSHVINASYDIIVYMVAIVAFFCLAYTGVQKGHISMGFVISRFSPRAQAVINSITSAFCLGVFVIVTWQIVDYASGSTVRGADSLLHVLPIYPLLYIIAFGSAILCLVFIYNLLKHLTDVIKGAQTLVYTGTLFLIILILVLFSLPLWGGQWLPEISPNTAGIIGLFLLVLLLFSGIPAGIAMALSGFLGIVYLNQVSNGFQVLSVVPLNAVASYSFVIVPVFLLITAFVQQSGMTVGVYVAGNSWFDPLPEKLALNSVAEKASNQSYTDKVGSEDQPKVSEHKNNPERAKVSITAGNAISFLIPPSMGLIIYGIIADRSIGQLFFACLIPGLLVSVLFVPYMLAVGGPSRKRAIGFIVLIPFLIWIIPLVNIFLGLATPVEASAMATIIALIVAIIVALVRRVSVFSMMHKSFLQAMHTTGTITLLLIGAIIFFLFIAMSGISAAFVNFTLGLPVPPLVMLIIIFLVYIILSCCIKPVVLTLLSLPIMVPIIVALGFDLIWFGVILMFFIGMSMLISPYSMNFLVSQKVDRRQFYKGIIIGAIPSFLFMLIVLGLLIIFPRLVMWLPNLMS
jgi:C4-dicarboxylate transporter DctM subunit